MTIWKDYQLLQNRQADLIRRAERRRLVASVRESAQGDQTPRVSIVTRIYAPALVRLGAMMVNAGKRLQEHYSELKTLNTRAVDDHMAAELEAILKNAGSERGYYATDVIG